MSSESSTAQALSAVAAFFGALHRAEWDEAAAMIDRKAADDFRTAQLAALVAWARHRVLREQMRDGGDGFVAWSSDGRLDSAMLDQCGSTPLRGVPGVHTLAELGVKTPLAFVAKYLEVVNPVIGATDSRAIAPLTRKVLGGVVEGEVVHVLYRSEGAGIECTDPYHVDLVRLRRREHAWRIDLTSVDNDLTRGGAVMMMSDDIFPRFQAESDNAAPEG